jgi:hypothetical protein
LYHYYFGLTSIPQALGLFSTIGVALKKENFKNFITHAKKRMKRNYKEIKKAHITGRLVA